MYKYALTKLKEKAEQLANIVSAPHAVILQGNLGAGKTTFAQYFLKPILLQPDQSVVSPTFTLINVYETIKGPIWHADLYRLKNEDELFELGLIEFVHSGISLIEWANYILPYLGDVPRTIVEL